MVPGDIVDQRFSIEHLAGSGGMGAVHRARDTRTGSPVALKVLLGVLREDAVVRFAGEGENLCLGGGLMLNAPLVTALENSGRYKNVWVQPAAGNAGTSIGCAFYAWHRTCRQTERHRLDNLFLGPEYDREDIKQVLENCKLRFRYLTTDEAVIGTAVQRLNEIHIPTLLVAGGLDHPEILRAADLMASHIPDAKKAVIPDAAHLPNMEKAAEFNQIVLNFLQNLN